MLMETSIFSSGSVKYDVVYYDVFNWVLLACFLSPSIRTVECYVARYAKYLSEEMDMPSVDFEVEYHRMRGTALLRNYGLQKAKKGYVSDNDDPPGPRTKNVYLPDKTEIVSVE
ncbi:hypothetical protein BC332_28733 [Capsicum chinense]|nr:hypothetical protein BC332_28733 [Capsicum chinense]